MIPGRKAGEDVCSFILYRRNRLIGKFINLKSGKDSFNRITGRFGRTINAYSDLASPGD